MLLSAVVIIFGLVQTVICKCSTNDNNYMCNTTCNIIETSTQPSNLSFNRCGYSDYFNIEITNSQYEDFTLQSIITNDIACNYRTINITITNSTIYAISSNAFPSTTSKTWRTCTVNYENIKIEHTMLPNVSYTKTPATYPANARYVSLANNNMEKINFFQLLSNNSLLKELDISENPLKVLDTSAFQGLTNPEFINISHNLINVINNTFIAMNHLHLLDLSFNNITKLKPTFFKGLSVLSQLDLGNNQIDLIDNAFNDTKQLHTLKLSNNSLSQINFNTFSGLNNLKILDLSKNKIIAINHAFIDLINLNHLNLSYNKIKLIDFNMFTGLSQLEVLDLSRNDIIALDEHFAVNIPVLRNLIISYNEIENLNIALFDELSQLEVIDINNNNINCYKLISYSKFFIKRKIQSVKGTQRHGIHFQGISCNNDTIIQQYDDQNDQNNQHSFNNDIIKLLRNLTSLSKHIIEITNIAEQFKNYQNSSQDDKLIQNDLKNIENNNSKYNVVMGTLIIIMMFIMIILNVYDKWKRFPVLSLCKQKKDSVNSEVEMNISLL